MDIRRPSTTALHILVVVAAALVLVLGAAILNIRADTECPPSLTMCKTRA